MCFFTKMLWRFGLTVLAASAIAFALSGITASAAPRAGRAASRAPRGHVSPGGWVGTWAASPTAPDSVYSPTAETGLTDETVRNVLHATVGGSEVRVRFTNTFGKQPLVMGAASIGIELQGAHVVPDTIRPLTFAGKGSVTIPVGQEVDSDPVSFSFTGEQNLAVSVFVPDATGPATYESGGQSNFISTSGDFSQDPSSAAYTTTSGSVLFVDGVDVVPSDADVRGSVVAIGDSITVVGGSSNLRWPDVLAGRLAELQGPTLSVVDEGIGGNRVLNSSLCFGDSALERFNRDVLDQSSVRDVMILEGVNDIGFSQTPLNISTSPYFCHQPTTNVSAQQIINGYEQMIAAAHARGLKIFGATLTPFKNAYYWDPAAEQKRDTINTWIRTSATFDGFVDFARILADPYDPDIMNPIYDSGDHLHPNDAGLVAMGNAINLRMLLRR